MKLTLTLIAVLGFMGLSQAQFTNLGFEDWTTNQTFDHPDTGDDVFLSGNYESFFENGELSVTEVPGAEGSAMRVESIEYDGEAQGSFAIWGNPPQADDLVFTGGFTMNDPNATGINLDLRYSVNASSPALIIVQFLENDVLPASDGNFGPGTYLFQVSGEQTEFTNQTFTFDPPIGFQYNQCVIGITSNDIIEDDGLVFSGDYIEIDNLSFVGSSDVVPGGDLNTWLPEDEWVSPDSWDVFENPFVVAYNQSTDAAEGDYALELVSVGFDEDEVSPSIAFQGNSDDDGLDPSVELPEDFIGFSFQYKYSTPGIDTGLVYVGISEVLDAADEDIYFEILTLNATEEYQTATMDFSGVAQFFDLNYMTLVFSSSYSNSDFGVNAVAGSTLLIDDIQFIIDEGNCEFDVDLEQTSPVTLCPEETAILSVPNEFDSYQWWQETVGGGLFEAIEGATSSSLEINSNFAGNDVWCEVTLDGCTESSNSMTVNAYIFEITEVSANTLSICENDSVILTASGAEGVVEWYLDGTFTGFNENTYISYDGGDYSAVIYPIQCPNYAIESAGGPTVVSNPLPTPEITVSNDVELSTGDYAEYQWYTIDGNSIPDATMQTYTATENGIYFVMVTDANGCSAIAASVGIVISNISELNMNEVSVYPIPAQSHLTIDANPQGIALITDLTGRIIMTQSINGSQRIDISALESGTYLMILNEQVIRWMKE